MQQQEAEGEITSIIEFPIDKEDDWELPEEEAA